MKNLKKGQKLQIINLGECIPFDYGSFNPDHLGQIATFENYGEYSTLYNNVTLIIKMEDGSLKRCLPSAVQLRDDEIVPAGTRVIVKDGEYSYKWEWKYNVGDELPNLDGVRVKLYNNTKEDGWDELYPSLVPYFVHKIGMYYDQLCYFYERKKYQGKLYYITPVEDIDKIETNKINNMNSNTNSNNRFKIQGGENLVRFFSSSRGMRLQEESHKYANGDIRSHFYYFDNGKFIGIDMEDIYNKESFLEIDVNKFIQTLDKTNLKIIGYKSPVECYGIPAGKMFILGSEQSGGEGGWYYPENGNSSQSVPKLIVESSWEPVYETPKLTLPMINGHDGEILSGKNNKIWMSEIQYFRF